MFTRSPLRLLSHSTFLLLTCCLVWSGCYLSDNVVLTGGAAPPEEGTSCDTPDMVQGMLTCKDGTWTRSTAAMSDMMCEPLTDSALCKKFSAQCGSIKVIDNCEQSRDVQCAPCLEGQECNIEALLCECVPQTEQELCDLLGLQCGESRTLDRCGMPRTVQCGTCQDTDVLCEENMCSGCLPESNQTLCERQGAACGLITSEDNCGELREEVACGTCQAPDVCFTDTNTCACVAEDDGTFCAREGTNCGTVTDTDNCGATRTVDCGTCPQGECMDDNNCSVCSPETDAAFCARQNAQCGEKSGMDNCGIARTDVECGLGCGRGESCENNQCTCPSPVCPNAESCGVLSYSCGSSVDCGGCDVGEQCAANQCTCPAPACGTGVGTQCGTLTSICGSTSDCGTCPGAHDACLNNTCICQGESDFDLCNAENAQCGNIFVLDRCGASRSISCGVCRSNETCANNSFCCPNTQICQLEELER